MVFHEVERLDVVKMVHLLTDVSHDELTLVESMKPIYRQVMKELDVRRVVPHIADKMDRFRLFDGLNDDQARRLAAAMTIRSLDKVEHLFEEGEPAHEFFVVLDGSVEVFFSGDGSVVHLGAGEVVGENAMLSEGPHSATVTAQTNMTVAVLQRSALDELSRRRPDIALTLYRNLAVSLGAKLARGDRTPKEGSKA